MLRSLVGSEMCIRDRPGHGASHLPVNCRGAWREHSGGKQSGRRRYLYFCLLYTSDAADDLLCVDLGGRRLIKTKN